jgi:hypothetical protein
VFHCAGGKDRTGLLALVLLPLAGAAPDEIIAGYLLTCDRMKQRYDELGLPDQLTAVTALLASHGIARCPVISRSSLTPTAAWILPGPGGAPSPSPTSMATSAW